MNGNWKWAAWLFAPLVAAAGCNSAAIPLQPVEGEVRVAGEPAERVFIMLHPLGEDREVSALRPSGWTDAAGRFRLTTFSEGDGAPPGRYAVTLEWPAPLAGAEEGTSDPETLTSGADRFKGKYLDPASGLLETEVISGRTELEPIEVK